MEWREVKNFLLGWGRGLIVTWGMFCLFVGGGKGDPRVTPISSSISIPTSLDLVTIIVLFPLLSVVAA